MIKSITLSVLTLLFAASLRAQINYPETRKSDVVDTLFYVAVADPYRWLEDDKSAETGAWVKAENTTTEGYLSKIPFRKKLHERLEKIWNYEKFSTPFKKGEYYFFTRNDGVQNQPVICMSKGLGGKGKELLDVNKLSPDGTIALTSFAVSNDGKYLAYSTAKAGSDWETINILDVETLKPLSDELSWVKFSGLAWKGNTLYYSRYPDPPKGGELTQKNENHRVYSHVVGNEQTKDAIVFENREHPLRTYTAQVTDDEKFLVVYESESTSGNALYIRDLLKKESEWKFVVTDFKNDYRVIDNIGNTLLVLTNRNAPKYRLVAIGADKIEEDKWKVIIKEKNDEVLQNAVLAGEKLVTQYMKEAVSKLYINTGTGVQESEITLPSMGTVDAITGTRGVNSLLYSFSSFTTAPTIYDFDLGKKKSEVLYAPKLDFKADAFETEQVMYKSKDGTDIPMFIVHKKGMELDGTAPTMIYAYGGFNISQTPSFKVERLAFLEQGGVFALPCIRGGGEYGEEWHQAGMKLNKQNVFDDFMAAAEYLATQRYTSPEFTAITGRSNGGLLIGACVTQRPELYRVAVPEVGVMDMLRYHKFTIGWAWANEYGSPDDSTQFMNLITYSPLHNIKDGVNYPAILITTGDHDDRVVPAHSFKFAATLQDAYKGDQPMLIRIDANAGHGAGKPTSKLIDERADVLSFMMFNLGMNPKFK